MKKIKLPYCKCGCGKRVKLRKDGTYGGAVFRRGHNNKKSSSKNAHNRFKKGNKHGKGRPCGSRNKITLAAENIFENEAGTIARQAVDMAMNGHPQMIKLILERVVPIKKSLPVKIQLPQIDSLESASSAMRSIIEEVAAGTISPLDGETISRTIYRTQNSIQVSDLELRLQDLEDKLSDPPS